ncbi:MAG: monovalent cation:proton antiporter-2 (CPA2) family protein [Halothiobacillaceae bacterium]|nr:monovalent cation:proton antiporter-2 (CPA2) family protein [Halothiobacillaceae bacterium]
MHTHILGETLILLAIAVVVVVAFRRLALPAILAYLGVGAVVGPFGMGWVSDSENIRFIAEFGVVFLLFTLGLEFSLPKLMSMRRAVLGMGSAQVIATTVIAGGIALLAGFSLEAAFVIGGVFAMSSTAIVIKQLGEQMEVNSRHGLNAIGILLFQDLAVIPFLILIPILSSGGDESEVTRSLLWALGSGIVVTAFLLAVGRWVLRPLFREIANARSAELFTLAVLLVALSAAWLTEAAGLSMALGAFLAGIMLSETEFRHQIETDIRPFRDVLLGLFFVTIGMMLNLRALPEILPWVVLILALLIALKVATIFLVGLLSRENPGVSLRTGLVLAQSGEFGFVLLALVDQSVLSDQHMQIILAAVILSMVLTPFLVRYNGRIAKRASPSYRRSIVERKEEISQGARELERHVILCGFGRVGQNLANFIEQEGVDYVALEVDPDIVYKARQAGLPVHFGNSTHQEILHAAGILSAKALVITHHDITAAIKTVSLARNIAPGLPILVRTPTDQFLEELIEAGATEVVPDAFEASLMLSSYLLGRLGVPLSKIIRMNQQIRRDNYSLLRHTFRGQEVSDLDIPPRKQWHLQSVHLVHGSHGIGQSLGELRIEESGVIVDAIRRSGIKGQSPDPETRLQEDDVLILYGTESDLARVEKRLLSGRE